MATNITDLQRTENKELSTMSHKDQIKYLLQSNKEAIAAALPKHLNPDRLLQVAVTAAVTTPALRDCYVPSLIGAVMQCSAMGLEPNTVMGHAYLVPFRNRKKNRTDVQVIVGYKGLLDLARRSGAVKSIASHEVREHDHFEYMYGLEEKLEHRPAEGDRGEITHFYAVAHMTDGGHAFEVMTKAAVDLIMSRTQSRGESGPWKDYYTEMGRKTVWRRLAKWVPTSVELARAINLDDMATSGADQALDRALEGDFEVLEQGAAIEHHQGMTEVITDKKGVSFDADLHVAGETGPVFNQDGSFRKKRNAATKDKDSGGDAGLAPSGSGESEPDAQTGASEPGAPASPSTPDKENFSME